MPLTAAQIAAYAANAGFSGSSLQTAVAIALAESSGNPSVVGDTNITPGGSVGLMQINLAAHPQYTAAQLLDPQANMDAAYQVYQSAGGSFTPWTTYNTGAAAAYLPSTALVSASLVPSNIIDTSDDSGDSSNLIDGIDPGTLILAGLVAAVGVLWWMAD
jgi:hypothetical protein